MGVTTCQKGNIHLIGVPTSYAETISRVTAESLETARNLLKYDGHIEIVLIEAQDFLVIPQLGITGSAVGKTCIEIKIDFSRKDVDTIVSVEIPATIYHELSHLVRENRLGYGNTLLDAMVSEGVACYVEKSVSTREIPYIQPIKDEEVWWSKAQDSFNDVEYNHSAWFFGTGELPNWIGYRLGYVMVERYMKKYHVDLSELSTIPSKEIFFT